MALQGLVPKQLCVSLARHTSSCAHRFCRQPCFDHHTTLTNPNPGNTVCINLPAYVDHCFTQTGCFLWQPAKVSTIAGASAKFPADAQPQMSRAAVSVALRCGLFNAASSPPFAAEAAEAAAATEAAEAAAEADEEAPDCAKTDKGHVRKEGKR